MIISGDYGDTLVQFGSGDVFVSRGRQQGLSYENEVILSNADGPHEIGLKRIVPEQLSSDLENPIRLQFGNIASLDTLIEELQNVRKQMAEEAVAWGEKI